MKFEEIVKFLLNNKPVRKHGWPPHRFINISKKTDRIIDEQGHIYMLTLYDLQSTDWEVFPQEPSLGQVAYERLGGGTPWDALTDEQKDKWDDAVEHAIDFGANFVGGKLDESIEKELKPDPHVKIPEYPYHY
ncbi:MAG: hypothetical protein OXD01_05000 [Gammaproteobacteria bacterium]|nr:hypothetical protein [Gammaproteobacteria bacterium]